MPMDVYTDSALTVISGNVSITKSAYDSSVGSLSVASGISVTAGTITAPVLQSTGTLVSSGLITAATGISITAGGISVTGGATIDQQFGGLSASAVSIGANGTIATNTRISRFTVTAAQTGIIMTTGTANGQTVVLSNETTTGSFTATMAASGTSNVLGGTGVAISGMTNRLFVWNGTLWN